MLNQISESLLTCLISVYISMYLLLHTSQTACFWSKINLISTNCYFGSPPKGERTPLDLEDEALLRDDDPITPIKKDGIKRKDRPTDKGVSWLVKTQYISSLSMDSTKQVSADSAVIGQFSINSAKTFTYLVFNAICSLWLKSKRRNYEKIKEAKTFWRTLITGCFQ